ncbi:YceD family protein [Marinicrinis sediminis]|uniref:YceD family protein n=1 Tax=Marinicrinis sediminis TaxID=1652465 RepID=A0ABW5R6W6_9BACL
MPIIVNMKELAAKQTPLELKKSLPLQHLAEKDKDIVKAEPLHIDLEVTAKSGTITVKGPCHAQVDFICARTLVQFTDEIRFDYEQQFTTYQTQVMDDEEMVFISEDSFDLVPYLEEAFMLSLPFIPVCKDVQDKEAERLLEKYVKETDENEADTTANSAPSIDPRLAGLKKFFDNDND